MVCAYQIFFCINVSFNRSAFHEYYICRYFQTPTYLLLKKYISHQTSAPQYKTIAWARPVGWCYYFFFDVDFEVGWSSKFLSNWRGHSLTTLKLDFGVCTVLMCKLAKKIAIGLLHIDNYKDWPLKVITNIILIWNRILAAMHITVSFSLRITIFFFT